MRRLTMRRFHRGARRLLGTLAALALLLPAGAAEAEPPFNEGLLFRIEKAGLAPSHIFGTIDSSDPRVLAVPEKALEAFDASARVVTALDIYTVRIFSRLGRRYLTNPYGRNLGDIIGQETFNAVAALAIHYGIAPGTTAGLNPWAMAVIFAHPAEEYLRREQGWPTLDEALLAEAYAQHKPVFALSKLEDRLKRMAALSQAKQIAFLGYYLSNYERVMQRHEAGIETYLNHDLKPILEAGETVRREIEAVLGPKLTADLIDGQNRQLAKAMQFHLEAGNAFIAVSAGRLPGEGDVLQLLEAAGYTVTKID